jgi:hypothetical protein
MLNNRGQAFSVFELMIAAIVAVAILFVLLPLLPNPDPVLGGPRDAIGNTLASVSSGGSFTSQEFTITKNTPITSSQFTKEGFDSRSIIMAVDNELDAQTGLSSFVFSSAVAVNDPLSYTAVTYTGNQSISLKAKVICEATGTLLKGTLDSIDGTFYSSVDDPTEHCGETEFSPCCIIILERK